LAGAFEGSTAAPRLRWLTVTLTAVMLTACGSAAAARPADSGQAASTARPSTPLATASVAPTPAPLVDPGLDLRAGPVDVPLELRIPALKIDAAMLGVGITPSNVMDTPKGPATDSVWRKAFWYRGGGTPGSASTATIAGHVDDVLGRPAVFANLKDLRAGASIVIHDLRTGLDIGYTVTGTANYTLRQTLEPAVLAEIYGAGPVAGQGPQPSADGLAHLTLITCAGNWISRSSTYDHRFAVYAVGVMPPAAVQQSPRSLY